MKSRFVALALLVAVLFVPVPIIVVIVVVILILVIGAVGVEADLFAAIRTFGLFVKQHAVRHLRPALRALRHARAHPRVVLDEFVVHIVINHGHPPLSN